MAFRLGIILFAFALGAVLRRAWPKSVFSVPYLNRWVLLLALPAVILISVPRIQWSGASLALILSSWILFLTGAVFLSLLGKIRGWSSKTIGALILTGCLGNTSFVGYPLVSTLLGSDALKSAVLVDQPGTFLILSTLGILIAARSARTALSISGMARTLLSFPPLMTLILALIFRHGLLGWTEAGIPRTVLDALGATLSPVALFSVGLQMSWGAGQSRLDQESKLQLSAALGYKLALGPAWIAFLYGGILSSQGLVGGQDLRVIVLESAMGPMITGSVLASEYGLGREIVPYIVGIGIPLSLVWAPLWLKLVL